jgi:hypothetical protein
MPMRRTPLKRAQHSLISDRALDCFRELQEYDAAEDRESHERWWYLHSRLCDEVSDKRLWEWPFVIHPDRASAGDEAAAARWQFFAAALAARDGTTVKR